MRSANFESGRKDAEVMKVDAEDPVDHNDKAADPSTSQKSSSSLQSLSGLVFLVSQENHQAKNTDPASLKEARLLLKKLTRDLKGTPETVLAQVHGLKNPSPFRLL